MRHVKIIMIFVLFIILASNTLAWGPSTHLKIYEAAIERSNSSIAKICEQNWGDYTTGGYITDSAVIYYYINWKEYGGTHNWLAYEKCLEKAGTDKQKAFCYGIGSHLAADSISHNYFIPRKIKTTFVGDYIVHLIVEAAVETKYMDPASTRMLDKTEDHIDFYNDFMGKDLEAEAKILRQAIGRGSFYDDVYTRRNVGLAFRFYNGISSIIEPLVNIEDSQAEFDRSVDNVVSVLEGTPPENLDPSGHDAIIREDTKIITVWMILAIVTALIFIAFLVRRGTLKKWIKR